MQHTKVSKGDVLETQARRSDFSFDQHPQILLEEPVRVVDAISVNSVSAT